MKKMLLATALALFITGCAQQTFYCSNKPAAVAPKETITHHFFVSRISRRKLSMVQIVAAQKNVVKQKTQQTFVNGLLGFITFLGIYTPLEVRVYCSQCNCMSCPSIWATLSALLINILLGSSCFCIVISLSEGEIIPFSGVCQSGGGCIIHAGGGGGFTH